MSTEIIVAIITSGTISTIVTKLVEFVSSWRGERYALRLLLKNEIRKLCLGYLDQGWIYADELDDLIDMHNCYHTTLHANGYLTELLDRTKELPIKGLPKRRK